MAGIAMTIIPLLVCYCIKSDAASPNHRLAIDSESNDLLRVGLVYQCLTDLVPISHTVPDKNPKEGVKAVGSLLGEMVSTLE